MAELITGDADGSVTEAGYAAPGTATDTGDLDSSGGTVPDSWQPVGPGGVTTNSYGTYELTNGGVWVYTLNNGNAAVQALNTGETLTDTFTAMTVDGNPQLVTITIHGANDEPVVTTSGGATAFVEGADTPSTPVVIDAGVTIDDPDSTTFSEGRIFFNGGSFHSGEDVLSFTPNAGLYGDIVVFDYSGGILYLTSEGGATTAQWQAALRSVTYTNTSDTPNEDLRNIGFAVSDGAAFSANLTSKQVTVAAANDAPVVSDLEGDSATYTEGDAYALLDVTPFATITDVDNPDFANGTIIVDLNAGEMPGEDIFFIQPNAHVTLSGTAPGSDVLVDGIVVGTYGGQGAGGQTMTVSFNATATFADAEQVLSAIAYSNLLAEPTAGTRTVDFQVTDGGGAVHSFSSTIDVVNTNDNPTIDDLDTDSASFTEGDAYALLDVDPAATVADVDSADFSGGTLTVSFGGTGFAQDRFDISPDDARVSRTPGSVQVDGVTIGSIDNDGPNQNFVITLNAMATPDTVAALLHAFAYFNSAGDNPTAGTRDVTITLTDGDTGSTSVTSHVQVTSLNDAAVITGDATGSVTEAGGVLNGTPGTQTDTGDLNSTDVDGTADAWQPVLAGADTDNHYGTYALSAAGVWTYTLDDSNAAVQALTGAATLTDTFTALTADGTGQLVTVTIHAQNDSADISGDAIGSVTEAGGVLNGTPGTQTDTGDLNSTDVDGTDDAWQPVLAGAATTNGYGTYALNAAGVWVYTLDDSNAAVQALNGSDTLLDTFTALTADGTAVVVNVTIHAQNDAAVITGDATGSVTEAGGVLNGTPGVETDTGDLNATDVDNTTDAWQAVLAGGATANGYGTYALSAAGVWTYTLDDSNAAVQALNGAATLTDTFTALTADGTGQLVTVTIHAQNNSADISGDAIGSVTEAGGVLNGTPGTQTDTDDLNSTDVDGTDDAWQPVLAGAATTNGYGTYALNAAGVWVYTLDDSNAAVQALNGSDTLLDTFTALTADGTAVVVNVTIHAQNDAADISGDAIGSVTEAGGVLNGTPGTQTDTGDLNSTDVDGTNDAWQPVLAGAATTGGYGTYALNAAGVWIYTLDDSNAAVQALNGSNTLLDTFTALTADGTGVVVNVTIHAQNDAAVITGDATGSVTEAGGTANGTPGVHTDTGDLNDTDVDNIADTWQVVAPGGATTNGYGTYALSAAGIWVFTLDDNNAAVQALDGSDTLTDTFTALTADGTSQLVTVTIHAQNDAPVNAVGAPASGDEDLPIALTGVSVSDVDSDPATDEITVQLSVAHGTLTILTNVLNGITGADITGGGNGTGGITLTATQDQINTTLAAMGGLTYQGDANFNGADALTVSTYDGIFSSAVSLAAGVSQSTGGGTTPMHIVTADVDHDGNLDLVYAENGTNQVAVQLGNGDGTFGAATLLSAGTNLSSVVIADMDGDTHPDLIVANYAAGGFSAGSVGVFYGDGLGGFGAMQTVAANVQSAYEVVTGDFNHDGRMDIAVDRRDFGVVGIILQEAGGTFAAPVYYTSSVPNYTRSILTGDYNGDGNLDIVAMNAGDKAFGNPPGTVSLLLGNADGTFQDAVDIATLGYTPWVGVAADLDGDGNLDLAFTSLTAFRGVTVMLGNGDGSFDAGVQYATATNATGLTATDVNGDGVVDLVAAIQGSPGNLATFVNNGDGTFQAALLSAAGVNPESVAAGDFDGDGDSDFVIANQTSNTLTYFANTTDRRGDIDVKTITVAAVNDDPVAVADVNGADVVIEAGVNPGDTPEAGDTMAIGNVLDNDTDVDTGDTKTVSEVEGDGDNVGIAVTGVYGSVIIDDDGSYTYMLNNGDPQTDALAQGESVTDVFHYTVADTDGATSTTTLTITITGTNDAPVAVADVNGADLVVESGVFPGNTEVTGDASASGNVLTNDTDVDNLDTRTVTAVLGGSVDTLLAGTYGSVTIHANGDYTYDLDNSDADTESLTQGTSVTDQFTYTVTDANGATSTATLTITISGTNDAPVAQDQSLAAFEDGSPVTAAFAADDVDLDDDPSTLAYSITSTVSEGQVTDNGDGTFTFDPGSDFQDLDGGETRDVYFEYTVTDSFGAVSNTGTVTFTVTGINDAPLFSGSGATSTYTENGAAVQVVSSVSVSDIDSIDYAGGTLSAAVTTGLHSGDTLSLAQSSTPGSGIELSGSDVSYNGTIVGTLSGSGGSISILLNASACDCAVQALTEAFQLSSSSDNPTSVTRTVTLTLVDGGGTANLGHDTASFTRTVDFIAVNDAPSGTDHAIAVLENTPRTLFPADFAFTDLEGNGFLSVTIVSLPGQGTIFFDPDGAGSAFAPTPITAGTTFTAAQMSGARLTYRADPDESGTNYTSFTYIVRDNGGTDHGGQDTDPIANTITINVSGFNNGPTVTGLSDGDGVNDNTIYFEDTPAGVAWLDNGQDAMISDLDSTDFNGGTLLVHIVAGEVPTEDEIVLATGGNGITTADIIVTVDDPDSSDPGDTIDVPATEVFVEGVSIGYYRGGGLGEDFAFTLNSGATPESISQLLHYFSYFNHNMVEPDTHQRLVEVRLTDGDGGTLSAFTTIEVVSVDDPATATGDSATTNEATPVTIDVTANDDDIDGPLPSVAEIDGTPISVGSPVTLASGAIVSLNVDGTLSYDPNHAFDFTPTLASGASNTPQGDSFTYTLALDGGSGTVEVTINGVDSNDILVGTAGVDTLNAGIGNDAIDGLAGADTMIGGTGNDIYIVDDSGDAVVENADEGSDLVYTSVDYVLGATLERLGVNGFSTTYDINLTGNGQDNEIWGNDGRNVLNGGAGADIIRGFGGDDIYIVDNAGDVVLDTAGFDTLYTSVSYVLSDEVERLGVNGFSTTYDINLTGNGQDNEIWGNDGRNVLNGGAGADILRGFAGDDIYIVDNAGDVVLDTAGFDLIYTSVTWVLGDDVERLGVNGFTTTYDINLTGNGSDNEMWGNDGANVLDGGAGADILHGNGGDDIYIVDNVGDLVLDSAGFDTIYTSVAYTLGGTIERLGVNDFTTTYDINLTGNGLDNEMWGNDGRNILDGGAGADILHGNGGDDIYFVDNAGDVVVDSAGFDLIYTSVSYTLDSTIERMGVNGFTTSYDINLTGNELDNELWGNEGVNVLNGGAGADILHGFAGNDIYVVDNVGDVVVDTTGFDLIYTSISYTLGDTIERLGVNGFTTTYAINLTGNGLDNEMWGNDGANVLDGRLGADILHGNGGADSFAFTTALGGGNVDTILDFAPGADKIVLDRAIFDGLGNGELRSSVFHVGTEATDEDQRIIYDDTTGNLYYDADGNGTSAAVLFATLTNHAAITAADFTVVTVV